MRDFLYGIVELITLLHNYLMEMNDSYEYYFSDKQLHFLIIGIFGMAMVLCIHPLFRWLARIGHTMIITWIYVFTLVLVITFAIEIGQKVTNTGDMEFGDIAYGVFGFISMFFVFAVIRGICHLIKRWIRSR